MAWSSFSEDRPNRARRSQLHFQLFDVQCLGMDLGGVGGEFDVLARELGLQVCGESAQCLRVGREGLVRQGHGDVPTAEVAIMSSVFK